MPLATPPRPSPRKTLEALHEMNEKRKGERARQGSESAKGAKVPGPVFTMIAVQRESARSRFDHVTLFALVFMAAANSPPAGRGRCGNHASWLTGAVRHGTARWPRS